MSREVIGMETAFAIEGTANDIIIYPSTPHCKLGNKRVRTLTLISD